MESVGFYKKVSPTGIAAVQINDKTVHSFFKLKKNGSRGCSITEQDRENFLKVRMILWDEISMTEKRKFSRALRNLRDNVTQLRELNVR